MKIINHTLFILTPHPPHHTAKTHICPQKEHHQAPLYWEVSYSPYIVGIMLDLLGQCLWMYTLVLYNALCVVASFVPFFSFLAFFFLMNNSYISNTPASGVPHFIKRRCYSPRRSNSVSSIPVRRLYEIYEQEGSYPFPQRWLLQGASCAHIIHPIFVLARDMSELLKSQ